jgi:predicted HAD superfamily Cof-like phosphohydrolase
MSINDAYEKVKQFQVSMGQPGAEKPTALTYEERKVRFNLAHEELIEFHDANNIVDQVDGVIDAIYILLGTLVKMGVTPAGPFDIVQAANMTKLWEDGKPRYRKGDGKILKPPHFQKPEPLLKKELDKQSAMADVFKELKETGDYETAIKKSKEINREE